MLLVSDAYRYDAVADINFLPLNRIDFIKGNDVRFMYSYKSIRRKNFLQLLHHLEGNDALGFGMNRNVVLKAFNKQNIIQLYPPHPGFYLHKNVSASSGIKILLTVKLKRGI